MCRSVFDRHPHHKLPRLLAVARIDIIKERRYLTVFKNIQKKRIIAIILAIFTLAATLSSCAKSGLAYDAFDCELSEYVSAGDISSIEVSKDEVETSVTNRFYSIMWQNSIFTDVSTDGKVQMYDKLIVDYTCAIDGLTIDAFTTKDASVFVGSGTMIDGMEEGLIGMAVGDEPRVMTLTFPDEYYSDLGGKEGVFTITLKNVFRPGEITDEIVNKYTVYKSMQEMREELTKVIAAEKAFGILNERAEVKKYPEAEYKVFYDDVAYLETYAKDQKMTVEEFLAKYGDQFTEFGFEKGMTDAEYRTACEDYAKRMTKEQMLVYYVLRELNVKTTGSPYNTMKKKILRDYSMSDVANYEDVYGEGSFETTVRYNLMLEALYTRVVLK